MDDKQDVFEIAKDSFILDTTGTAPEGAQLRSQADDSYKRLTELIEQGQKEGKFKMEMTSLGEDFKASKKEDESRPVVQEFD